MERKEHYLSNANILREIAKSKNTYCYFIEPTYAEYHSIVFDRSEINTEAVAAVLQNRQSKRRRKDDVRAELAEEDVVFRLMTYEHIPLDPDRVRKPKGAGRDHAKTNFPPFKHYCLREGDLVEVGRSHWKGGLENGHFSTSHGRITDSLARMFILLVERISKKGNFRDYSYIADMQGAALIQLCQGALVFDESKSSNPFSYLTSITENAFVRVLNLEKRQQRIRDDTLENRGAAPSATRQNEHALSHIVVPAPVKRKRVKSS